MVSVHVTLCTATFVTLPPVGRTVLGAPPLCDRRAALDAPIERDRQHPCHPRRVYLAATIQRIQSRGHSPRTIFTGAPTLFVHPRREGVEALPYGVVGRHPPLTHVALNPSVTARSAATAPPFRGAEGWVEVCGVCASVYHDADTVVFLPPVRGGVPDAPPLRDCRGEVGAVVGRDRL